MLLLKKTFKLNKAPKTITNTELISSPKEHLRRVIWKAGKIRYLNTVHNVKIAQNISLKTIDAVVLLNLWMHI
jgi:hypothetical protein